MGNHGEIGAPFDDKDGNFTDTLEGNVAESSKLLNPPAASNATSQYPR